MAAAVWALHFFVGVYKKLYGMDVSQSKAARKMRERMDKGLVSGRAGAWCWQPRQPPARARGAAELRAAAAALQPGGVGGLTAADC